MNIKCYSELILLPTFEERFHYLELKGQVGAETFGMDRLINQAFYKSREWQRIRNYVISRDGGMDLGVDGYNINGRILIHHMNPIREKDILERNPDILNPEYLISVSHDTHNAIHYNSDIISTQQIIERSPNDTSPWKH